MYRAKPGSILGSPTGFLICSETSPASFPAAKTLLQNYMDVTKFWKLLSAEPFLQEKSAIKAWWLELVPTSKAQLLVYFVSVLMYTLRCQRDTGTSCLSSICCIPSCPSENIPMSFCSGCLLFLGASKNFPMLGLGAGCQMWWECGGRKQFYAGSVAVAKLGAWSVLCPGCNEPLLWWRRSFSRGKAVWPAVQGQC